VLAMYGIELDVTVMLPRQALESVALHPLSKWRDHLVQRSLAAAIISCTEVHPRCKCTFRWIVDENDLLPIAKQTQSTT
jgi:hypothetical protein